MSAAVIGVAVLRSVCPGEVRRMRADSAMVTAISAPASTVRIKELPLTDLTLPTALAAGPCAKPLELSRHNKAGAIQLRRIETTVLDLFGSRRMIASGSIQTCTQKR